MRRRVELASFQYRDLKHLSKAVERVGQLETWTTTSASIRCFWSCFLFSLFFRCLFLRLPTYQHGIQA